MSDVDYQSWIASPGWQVKRAQALFNAHGKCQRCGIWEGEYRRKTGRGFDVHHLTYTRLGWENVANDLEVLCRDCHEVADEERKWGNRIVGWAKKVYGPYWAMAHTFDEVEKQFEHWLTERDGQ